MVSNIIVALLLKGSAIEAIYACIEEKIAVYVEDFSEALSFLQ